MKRSGRKQLFILLGVYLLAFFIIFPGYRHILDPDSTGYFAIAERVAAGDYLESVNGIWSPLSSWLLAPFIKWGADPILTAKYLNGLYGLIVICLLYTLTQKVNLDKRFTVLILFVFLLLVLRFVFARTFADLLLLVFVFAYLNIVCTKDFGKDIRSVVLAALVGGFAFYAKSYALYFTLVHLPLAIYIYEGKARASKSFYSIIKKISIALLVIFVITLPWGFAIKAKYGHFALSRVGQFNMTWSLSQADKQPGILFYDPPGKHGYSIWDDPSLTQQKKLSPLSNKRLFFFQAKLILSNAREMMRKFNHFSVVLILIVVGAIFLSLGKNGDFITRVNLTLLSFILIWPLGFLLLHVEERFLWAIIPPVILLANVMLTALHSSGRLTNGFYNTLILIFTASFCLYPIGTLRKRYGKGKELFEMADSFKRNGLKGNFISAHANSDEMLTTVKLNYLVGGKYFGPVAESYIDGDLTPAIKQYRIDHYILYYHSETQKQQMLASPAAKLAKTIRQDVYPGILVFSYEHDAMP
jgi:hypothetical protein